MQDFLSEAKAVQVLLPKAEEKLEHFPIQEAENMKSERSPPGELTELNTKQEVQS